MFYKTDSEWYNENRLRRMMEAGRLLLSRWGMTMSWTTVEGVEILKGGRIENLSQNQKVSWWIGCGYERERQLNSVVQWCPTICDPMHCSAPGFPVHCQLMEFTQTHVHWVIDAIQPSHPLSCPSPPVFNLSQHQGLFKWISSSHQVSKVLEFQLQHQSFQWIFRTYWLISK